jgi:osmotically-inducible protein OsmY
MTDVGAEVANALHWDLAIPRHQVTAQVDAGVVTLRGVVERAYLRSHAESIVRRVSGVIGVKNNIAVRPAEDLRQTDLRC